MYPTHHHQMPYSSVPSSSSFQIPLLISPPHPSIQNNNNHHNVVMATPFILPAIATTPRIKTEPMNNDIDDAESTSSCSSYSSYTESDVTSSPQQSPSVQVNPSSLSPFLEHSFAASAQMRLRFHPLTPNVIQFATSGSGTKTFPYQRRFYENLVQEPRDQISHAPLKSYQGLMRQSYQVRASGLWNYEHHGVPIDSDWAEINVRYVNEDDPAQVFAYLNSFASFSIPPEACASAESCVQQILPLPQPRVWMQGQSYFGAPQASVIPIFVNQPHYAQWFEKGWSFQANLNPVGAHDKHRKSTIMSNVSMLLACAQQIVEVKVELLRHQSSPGHDSPLPAKMLMVMLTRTNAEDVLLLLYFVHILGLFVFQDVDVPSGEDATKRQQLRSPPQRNLYQGLRAGGLLVPRLLRQLCIAHKWSPSDLASKIPCVTQTFSYACVWTELKKGLRAVVDQLNGDLKLGLVFGDKSYENELRAMEAKLNAAQVEKAVLYRQMEQLKDSQTDLTALIARSRTLDAQIEAQKLAIHQRVSNRRPVDNLDSQIRKAVIPPSKWFEGLFNDETTTTVAACDQSSSSQVKSESGVGGVVVVATKKRKVSDTYAFDSETTRVFHSFDESAVFVEHPEDRTAYEQDRLTSRLIVESLVSNVTLPCAPDINDYYSIPQSASLLSSKRFKVKRVRKTIPKYKAPPNWKSAEDEEVQQQEQQQQFSDQDTLTDADSSDTVDDDDDATDSEYAASENVDHEEQIPAAAIGFAPDIERSHSLNDAAFMLDALFDAAALPSAAADNVLPLLEIPPTNNLLTTKSADQGVETLLSFVLPPHKKPLKGEPSSSSSSSTRLSTSSLFTSAFTDLPGLVRWSFEYAVDQQPVPKDNASNTVTAAAAQQEMINRLASYYFSSIIQKSMTKEQLATEIASNLSASAASQSLLWCTLGRACYAVHAQRTLIRKELSAVDHTFSDAELQASHRALDVQYEESLNQLNIWKCYCESMSSCILASL